MGTDGETCAGVCTHTRSTSVFLRTVIKKKTHANTRGVHVCMRLRVFGGKGVYASACLGGGGLYASACFLGGKKART